ncbi:hypothetical protein EV368DRAFT_77686 [Lentinula lateritia]|nr:hypothetical protein EV368DRAFT_77686 [Lentinula lateritia]
MSSSSGHRTTDRPTLPPIRDLFGNELSRLRVSDDDDPAHHHDAQRRRSNDFSQRPFNVPPSRSSHPSHRPSEYFSAASHTSFSSQHTSYGREQHRPSTHLGYNSRSVTAPDHGHLTTASPVPAPDYRYPDMGVGPLSSQHSSVNSIATRDLSRGAGSRSYSNYDYLTHPRVSTTLDNRDRSEEAEYALNSLAQSYPGVQPPSRDMPNGSVAPPAKYECTYCGKGFNRPSSLKIHLNSHTGEKPFLCPVEGCGRSFSVLSNMRRHARVHNQNAQTSDDDTGPLSRPSSSRLAVTPVDWHQYRRGSTASDVSSSESRHSRSGSSDSEDEGYSQTHSIGKRVRQYHR